MSVYQPIERHHCIPVMGVAANYAVVTFAERVRDERQEQSNNLAMETNNVVDE